jgi:hypothetical protein
MISEAFHTSSRFAEQMCWFIVASSLRRAVGSSRIGHTPSELEGESKDFVNRGGERQWSCARWHVPAGCVSQYEVDGVVGRTKIGRVRRLHCLEGGACTGNGKEAKQIGSLKGGMHVNV